MKPKHQRLIFIVVGLICMILASFFILNSFRDNLVFFYTPTEIKTKALETKHNIRIGGLVVDGSVVKKNDVLEFTITDLQNSIKLQYKGIVPNLFRDGQGIVAQGKIGQDGIFYANNLLAKHDEKYMPPEVADALKKSGNWHPEKFK